MAAPSRHSPAELQAWRRRYRLTVAEMAWLLGIPAGTMKDKLSGRHPARLDTDNALDNIEMLLHRGAAPINWPLRLMRMVHNNHD